MLLFFPHNPKQSVVISCHLLEYYLVDPMVKKRKKKKKSTNIEYLHYNIHDTYIFSFENNLNDNTNK